MTRLTDEQKHDNARERMLQKFREYTLTRCKNKTAQVWQRLVRLQAIEPDGLVSCITCDWRGSHKDCDAGHFVPRRHSSTIFHPNNCHVQCRACNDHLSGNMAAYRLFIETTYGVEQVEELERLKQEVKQFTKEELVDLRMDLMARIKIAERKLSQ